MSCASWLLAVLSLCVGVDSVQLTEDDGEVTPERSSFFILPLSQATGSHRFAVAFFCSSFLHLFFFGHLTFIKAVSKFSERRFFGILIHRLT